MKKATLIIFTMLLGISLYGQKQKITGTIVDESNLPLPGVNIVIKGTKKGTQSDFDGNYNIEAYQGQTLVYTYVGYKTAEKVIGTSSVINIRLETDAQALDEVVVTALGIRRESHSIGYAVSSVRTSKPSASAIKRRKQKAYHNQIAQKLQGKVTGVKITSASGAVGAAEKIKIRNAKKGEKNVEPLYIVDGVPIQNQYNSIVKNIDKNEIEHINRYEKSKAKALFGTSAKNGCIVINTKKGNYRIKNEESYAHFNENQFENVTSSPLSTFSIDVDKASYSNVRRMINTGATIPVDAVKIEEMINYFNYTYPQPKDEHPFSINSEVITTPWNVATKLVRIGLQGKAYKNEEIPPANLVFLIDVSGSMSSQNKLPLLKSAFKLLVNQLRNKDKVSIVVYAGAAGMVLKPTSGDNKETILTAIDNLEAGGSTAGGAGIKLAYKIAEQHFKKNGNNRVILATDGDFNIGASSDKAMETLIEEKRKSNVFLSVLGFGMGNYKNSKLEILADKGNGNHAYIDTKQEAQKIFGEEFGGTLYTIAKDVKIQVEFNPVKVKGYRLIGYENRILADEDFIDDTKDAGELGSGHTVTALYEIIPVGVESSFLKKVDDLKYINKIENDTYLNELVTVKFRYKKPLATTSIQMIHTIEDEVVQASEDLKFISAVALFGMKLRKSQFDNNASLATILSLAEEGRREDKNGYRAEFIRLAKSLYNL